MVRDEFVYQWRTNIFPQPIDTSDPVFIPEKLEYFYPLRRTRILLQNVRLTVAFEWHLADISRLKFDTVPT